MPTVQSVTVAVALRVAAADAQRSGCNVKSSRAQTRFSARRSGGRAAAAASAIAALVLAGCAGADPSGPTTGPEGDGPIVIGTITDLSTANAISGAAYAAGASAFFDQLNADGGIDGRSVEFKVLDHKYDPQQAVTAAHALIEQDGAIALLAPFGTPQTEALFPYVLQQEGVPILGPAAGLSSWYDPPQRGLFGILTPYDIQGGFVGKWIGDDGFENVAIVHSDLASYAQVGEAAAAGVVSANPDAKTTDIPVKLGTTDYAPIIGQIKQLGADAVFLAVPTAEVITYLKAQEQQQLTAETYAYNAGADVSVPSVAGSAANGLHAVALTLPPNDDAPEIEAYRNALEKYAPDQEPTFYSLLGYADAAIFAQIVSTIDGPITSESIIDAYNSASGIETGILPPVTFSADHTMGVSQLVKLQITDGEYVQLGGFVDAESD